MKPGVCTNVRCEMDGLSSQCAVMKAEIGVGRDLEMHLCGLTIKWSIYSSLSQSLYSGETLEILRSRGRLATFFFLIYISNNVISEL